MTGSPIRSPPSLRRRPCTADLVVAGTGVVVGQQPVDVATAADGALRHRLVVSVGVLARWLFDRRIALIATAIAAVYANLWMNDALLMSETLAAVSSPFCSPRTVYASRAPTGAALLGAASSVSPDWRVPNCCCSARCWRCRWCCSTTSQRRDPGEGRPTGDGRVAAIVVISPWVVRNQVRFDDSITMSTQDGLTLIGTNCPAVRGRGDRLLARELRVGRRRAAGRRSVRALRDLPRARGRLSER